MILTAAFDAGNKNDELASSFPSGFGAATPSRATLLGLGQLGFARPCSRCSAPRRPHARIRLVHSRILRSSQPHLTLRVRRPYTLQRSHPGQAFLSKPFVCRGRLTAMSSSDPLGDIEGKFQKSLSRTLNPAAVASQVLLMSAISVRSRTTCARSQPLPPDLAGHRRRLQCTTPKQPSATHPSPCDHEPRLNLSSRPDRLRAQVKIPRRG
jgi:hypothetical protein